MEKAEGEERRRFKKISKDKDEHGQRGEERSFDRWPGRGVRAGRWRHRRGNDQWEKSPRVFAFNLRRELTERLNRGVAKKRGNARNRENVAAGKFNNNSLSLSRNFQLCAD